ncbi:hypothetical protein EZS27_032322 [termite gut metagenome]|uniref:Tc1-like transposase DDE domain-containing protein n=1 Tax=termite gut metagenome TaxID=433724 RepID=A0A5J4Q789_9ZZZZ
MYGICSNGMNGQGKFPVKAIPRQTRKHRKSIKKFQELPASQSLEFKDPHDKRPVQLFFQDEARFGRIDNLTSCRVPEKCRAQAGNRIIREYTCACTAACPQPEETFSLILPYAKEVCMDVFMTELSGTCKDYGIITTMDRASWHTGGKANKRENSVPLFQPPKSSELNPVEHLWHHIREKGNFKIHTFHSLCEVERHLMAELNKLSLDFAVKKITRFTGIKYIL